MSREQGLEPERLGLSELSERRRFRIDVIATGTAIFIAVVGFLAIRNQLDIFGQVLGVSVIGFFVILWLGIFILPVGRSISFPNLTVVTNKEDLTARKHMGELRFFVERFHKMCKPDHGDTIMYPLASLRSRGGDFANLPYPNPIHVELLLIQIPKALDLMKQNKATLAWGVETFNWVLRIFNDQLVIPTVTAIRTIAANVSLPQDVKEDYNTNRLAYLSFLNDYDNFVDRANKELGSPEEVKLPESGGSYTVYPLRHIHMERPKEL